MGYETEINEAKGISHNPCSAPLSYYWRETKDSKLIQSRSADETVRLSLLLGLLPVRTTCKQYLCALGNLNPIIFSLYLSRRGSWQIIKIRASASSSLKVKGEGGRQIICFSLSSHLSSKNVGLSLTDTHKTCLQSKANFIALFSPAND